MPSSPRRRSTSSRRASSGKASMVQTSLLSALVPRIGKNTVFHKYFKAQTFEDGSDSEAGWFRGKVQRIWTDKKGTKMCNVLYDDGDREDLTVEEIQSCQTEYKKAHPEHSSSKTGSSTASEGSPWAAQENKQAARPTKAPTTAKTTTKANKSTVATTRHPLRPQAGNQQESVVNMEEDDLEEDEKASPTKHRRRRLQPSPAQARSDDDDDEEEESPPKRRRKESSEVSSARDGRSRRARSAGAVSYVDSPDEENDDDEEMEESETVSHGEESEDDDDVLEVDDESDDLEEDEESVKPTARKRQRTSKGSSATIKSNTSHSSSPPRKAWVIPYGIGEWEGPCIYDYKDEIPSDAEDEILEAAKKSRVEVRVRTQASASKDGKKSRSQKDRGEDSRETVDKSRAYVKAPYTDGDHLPVISEPQEMFDDMVRNFITLPHPYRAKVSKKGVSSSSMTQHAPKASRLVPLLKALHRRPLRVATMCSGTESPILALDMLQNSIQHVCQQHLEHDELEKLDMDLSETTLPIEHVFSCEIEPFKQAYIERNFRPPLLFRDIRELGDDEAYTAYGALAKVPNTPGCVDLLIAGTSCVDYSNLNNTKKTIDQKGESGQTFWGMVGWIKKAQPPLIVIENVYGAPWDKKVEIFKKIGYLAKWGRYDTKDYYIPHTRQRGYLFAIRADGLPPKTDPVERWHTLLVNLKRPASASLEQILLDKADPRVVRGRARLTAESCSSERDSNGDRAGRTDWTKCETRHLYARSNEDLGEKRPLTGWSDSGATVMPAFACNQWTNAQVHRIHDLMDINTLRMAKAGVDCTYKSMVWNLSQNVDRDTMGKLGLCQCLTPTGVPYLTNRGAPLVGEELLKLQGIPSDDLILTKETESNLKDLAGNAMSTTVVGAVTLCALLQGVPILQERDFTELPADREFDSLVPRPLQKPSDTVMEHSLGMYEDSDVDLGPVQLSCTDWDEAMREAHLSSRMCHSEGVEECIPVQSVMVCRDCGETSGKKNALPVRRFEEHEFVPMDGTCQRVPPQRFRTRLLHILPMVLSVHGILADEIEKPSNTSGKLFAEWHEQLRSSLEDESGAPAIFHFADLLRSKFWTAIYKSQQGAKLEARFQSDSIVWLLFVAPFHERGDVREWLHRPVARLTVERPKAGTQTSLIAGTWQVCLPTNQRVQLEVRGQDNLVPSWRNRLGLKGDFESECQFESLDIKLLAEDLPVVKARVDGSYKFLPKCGTACGSLMKKRKKDSEKGNTFFFLESGLRTLGDSDKFVFAETCHRTSPTEHREILVHVDLREEFRPVYRTEKEAQKNAIRTIKAVVPGKWVSVNSSGLAMPASFSDKMSISRPVENADSLVKVELEGCKRCTEILSCTFSCPDDLIYSYGQAGCVEVNLQKSKVVMEKMAFATSRLMIPSAIKAERTWIALDRARIEQDRTDDDVVCSKCSPSKPRTMWKCVEKNRKKIYTAIEDGQDAATYERCLKERPKCWIIRISNFESPGRKKLSIGCNAVSLVHRAHGLFPTGSRARHAALDLLSPDYEGHKCRYEWRILPHIDSHTTDFKALTFCSNKKDQQAAQPPNFKRFPLRLEQLRSLSWMLMQERTEQPFLEEEVVEEVLPHMGWRAEGRVQRPVLVRGGIIADEVGYGKTAISLGLIDSSGPSLPALPKDLNDSLVATKATLVIVPGHLLGQWPNEVDKFLGRSKKRVVLRDMGDLKKITVAEMKNADIVIVGFKLLCTEIYYKRLARLVGVKPSSFPSGGKGGRHFDQVYQHCLSRLSSRVDDITNDCGSVFQKIEADAKGTRSSTDEILRLDRKSSIYKNTSVGNSKLASPAEPVSAAERDPWGLSSNGVKQDHKRMTCPPLEMFFWKRIVVDEFTYLVENERERVLSLLLGLKSSFRWCLSGTPQHSNFDDVKLLASLLGIHLGVDEHDKLSQGRGVRTSQESTGLENMAKYLEVRSSHWHERRHHLAQSFLKRFVRQNVAEIDEIPSKEHVYKLTLPPAETAIYLELETTLKSLDMNNKNAQKSKKKSTGDRESRMQKVLRESATANEALLKGCSHFNMDGSGTTALETMDDIVKIRMSEKKSLERDIINAVAATYRLHHKILALQPDWNAATKNEKGEIASALNSYLTEVNESRSVSHGADDFVHERLKKLVLLAEATFRTHPNVEDEVFEDAFQSLSSLNATKSKKGKKEKESGKDESIYIAKRALLNYMHKVRAMGKELCGRVRSLRFVQRVHELQNPQAVFDCEKCGAKGLNADSVAILSSCGHFGCVSCVQECASNGRCIEHPVCSADVSEPHVVCSDRLNLGVKDESGGRYGKKLSAIVDKATEILNSGDRALVFCQYDDLIEKVNEALESSKVKTLQVKGTVKQQIKALEVFQNEKRKPGDPGILLLKMDDEQSAGLNLTNLNHAIFVHPLDAATQQQYDAYETQAIGRIRRYGQKKCVHVHRFLVLNTIDTEIYSKRSGRRLCDTTGVV